MRNICHECVYHEKCMVYRYNNIQTKSMKEVSRIENRDGNTIIFVEKCDNFKKRKFKYVPEKLAVSGGIDKLD